MWSVGQPSALREKISLSIRRRGKQRGRLWPQCADDEEERVVTQQLGLALVVDMIDRVGIAQHGLGDT